MLTVENLEFFANKFLMENFDMRLEIPITINGRLRSTLGRFRYSLDRMENAHRPLDIQIARYLIEYNPEEAVLDTLYHECVHYALYVKGLPHNDSDNLFIETCNKLKVGLTRTYRAKALKHKYVCGECGATAFSINRMNGAICRKCNVYCGYEGQELH